jgi:DNA-binding transcriptional LysR family regulator
MDRFKQLETLASVAARGSLAAAAKHEGIAAAVIGRRLDALEQRLGVRLLIRTTRRITLTPEGKRLLEDTQPLLSEIQQAEEAVSAGSTTARGLLRITAPAGFGRRHVAALMTGYLAANPEVKLRLDLSDRVVNLVQEGFDLAIRIGHLEDSTLVGVKLAESKRRVVGSPEYFRRFEAPQHPHDLVHHQCLTFGAGSNQARGWLFSVDGKITPQRAGGRLECNDGAVLHRWALEGQGLAWRSEWEVAQDLASGRLVSVLDDYAVPDNSIYAVFAKRKHLPLRVRTLLDYLKHHLPEQLRRAAQA